MLRAFVLLSVIASLLVCTNAFTSPLSLGGYKAPRLGLRPAGSVSMKVDLLQKVETLKVLTAVSKAGLLSKVEKAGLLSKLEKQGALSQVEKLLPLLDDYRAISLLTNLVNIEPLTFTLGGTGILLADAVLVAAVPDSSSSLIALQVVATLLAVTAATPLFIGAQLNSIIQSNTPIGQ